VYPFLFLPSPNIDKKMKKIQLLLWLLGLTTHISAQIISTSPLFPKASDNVIITYDASLGNAALSGVAGAVYAHTGVITDKSTSNSDWKYVQGSWGTTSAPLMTSIGNNKYTISMNTVRSFYGVPANEEIIKLAFVFRNQSGSVVGRSSDGSDIYTDIYSNSLSASISNPLNNSVQAAGNVSISGAASETANLELWVNGSQVSTAAATSINFTYNAALSGNYEVVLKASNTTSSAYDTVHFVVNPSVQSLPIPSGIQLGINYTSSTSVTLLLNAPFKNNIYVLGDFNNWQLNTSYFMKRDPDGKHWWLEITGLTAGQYYSFQYLIDGGLKVADPHSELVLDPWNDQYIPASTFPNLPLYPVGKTTGITSLFQANKPTFNWQETAYSAPKETDLVIYELLVRDFIAAHDYQTLLDTLDYLENLGINAIQFMPINEFEGNESWGYNPSFHMALDKYYGTPESFKILVNECHKRGIAVILDVVYNHAFSQSPLCQMYWDPVNFKPNTSNPFVNPDAKHDFNVGYDFNHESPDFRAFMKRCVQYWLTEYKVDGFRFDLSKGFTQNNTLGNTGAWGNYDASRVANLKRLYGEIKAVNPSAYVILEHFGDNSEEKELANSGMMLWGNLNHEYSEAAMGYSSNLNRGSYKNRGWNNAKALVYAESHDEERVVYRCKSFGNVGSGYSIKSATTAMDRMALVGVFLNAIPGPKMIWQFGELGYDFSIEENGRVGNKPIKWDYFTQAARKKTYDVYAAMNKLKIENDAFEATDFGLDVGGTGKRVYLNGSQTKAVILGNFDVTAFDMSIDFQHTGMWYEYFSGDSVNVTNTGMPMYFEPGEFAVWTDVKLKQTAGVKEKSIPSLNVAVFPNPASQTINFVSPTAIDQITIYDMSGREVMTSSNTFESNELDVSGLATGCYSIRFLSGTAMGVTTLMKQ
jgi:glycosidase